MTTITGSAEDARLRERVAELENEIVEARSREQSLLSTVEEQKARIQRMHHASRFGLSFETPNNRSERVDDNGNTENSSDESIVDIVNNHIPYLQRREDKSVRTDDTAVVHTLIKGDNFPALLALIPEYENSVDIIYIDPPYNTGNKDFVYDDDYVNSDDRFKHSKWLSFMARRLLLARELLSETGVLFVSIDDSEQAYLKVLLDEIFGERNFVANMVWRNVFSSSAKMVNTTHEYVLVYAKNARKQKRWRFQRPSEVHDVLTDGISADNDHETNKSRLRLNIKKSLRRHPELTWVRNYRHVDNHGHVFYARDLSVPGTPNRVILSNGMVLEPLLDRRWQSAGRIDALIEDELIWWIKDRPYEIQYLSRETLESYSSIVPNGIYTRTGKAELKRIISPEENRFSYPKPTALIEYLLQGHADNVVVLDFFAGSGTTAHAASKMNAADGGTRKTISVTDAGKMSSDSVDIADDIAFTRLQRVLTGEDWAKPDKAVALKQNLEMLDVRVLKSSGNRNHDIKLLTERIIEDSSSDADSVDDYKEDDAGTAPERAVRLYERWGELVGTVGGDLARWD